MKNSNCKIPSIAVFFLTFFAWCLPAKAQSDILSFSMSGTVPCSGGVTMPAYHLYLGCAPTSIAMILAYWDLRYNDYKLFSAQGNNLFLTDNVENEISNIASACGTGINGEPAGVTDPTQISNGLKSYTSTLGYNFNATLSTKSSATTWNYLTSEINAGRPILFTVDENGTGTSDHAVPVFGYDTSHLFGDGSTGPAYACYTTDYETETPVWEKFICLSDEQKLGGPYVPYAFDQNIKISSAQTPESTTLVYMFSGVGLLLLMRPRRFSSIRF